MKRNAVGAGLALLSLLSVVGGESLANPRKIVESGGKTFEPVTDPAEIGVWLRQLAGRYRFEGTIEILGEEASYDYSPHQCGSLPPPPSEEGDLPIAPVPYCTQVHGVGDCVAIGSGPGVQCVLDVSWVEQFDVTAEGAFELPGFVPFLSPAMILFGLDPGEAGIRFLLVNHKGLPEGGVGRVAGNRATFHTPCVNGPSTLLAMRPRLLVEERPLQSCVRVIRVDAKPDSSVVHWSMDIEINDRVFTRSEMTLRREQSVAPDTAAPRR